MKVHDFIEQVDDFDSLTKKEQVKLIAFFHCAENSEWIFSGADIKEQFEKNALPSPSNISLEIKRLKSTKPPVLLETRKGLTFHRNTKKELEEIYLSNRHKREVSLVLRELIVHLKGTEQQQYLEEAITCFEVKAFRAAIILTWLLAMDILYEFVLRPENLTKFNQAIQAQGKYKKISFSQKDDFTNIKESDFIEILRVAKLVTNDSRKILDEKLGIRNSCAHPNTLKIMDYKAIGFIQDMVTNIIQKYQ